MEIGALTQYGLRAPAWLTKLFHWGPSEWPISWCELVREKTLDCGVLAALAREVFRAQGHEAHPAQALLMYNGACTEHWRKYWKVEPRKPEPRKVERLRVRRELFPWIGDQVVYHELCLIERSDGTARIYDSTWGTWLEPDFRPGFGGLLAVRTECPRLLSWGNRTLSCGEWTQV
jgi:hypothetical protein